MPRCNPDRLRPLRLLVLAWPVLAGGAMAAAKAALTVGIVGTEADRVGVRRDVDAVEPHLTALHAGVALGDLGVAFAEALDLATGQHQAGLVGVEEAGLFEGLEHTVGRDGEDRMAPATGDVPEGMGQEGLADTDGADDVDVEIRLD